MDQNSKKYCIYIHQNIINKKVYIGYSENVEERWQATKSNAFYTNYSKYEEPFYRAIRRDGWDNFTHQIIERFDDKKEALEAEVFWIEFFRSNRKVYGNDYGYNMHKGGNCPPSRKGLPGTMTGKKLTEEHKAKISQAHKDGRIPVQISIFSEEIRNQIIEERKSGKSISELKIQYNISNTHLYRILKECVNLKGQMKHNLGKSWKLVNGKRVWSVKNGT